MRDFKEGAAYIAIKAGVPVVPMAIVGMRELLPMGSAHLRSGKVIVRVAIRIPTKDMTIKDRDELTERLYRDVARLLGVDPGTREPMRQGGGAFRRGNSSRHRANPVRNFALIRTLVSFERREESRRGTQECVRHIQGRGLRSSCFRMAVSNAAVVNGF